MAKRESIDFVLTGKSNTLQIILPQPFRVPETHIAEIGLKNAAFFHSIPNIDEINNSVMLRAPGSGWELLQLPSGAYEIDAIANKMLEFLQFRFPLISELIEKDFKLSADESTGCSVFSFKSDGFAVKFDTENSLAPLLGFPEVTEISGIGLHRSPGIVNISNVGYVFFNTNISDLNYMNDVKIPSIFAAILDVAPGFRFYRELSNISYKMLNTNQFSHLKCWLTDEHMKLLNLRGETVTVTLTIRLTARGGQDDTSK